MEGLLVVDKPVGPTSHDVVARIRRATGERRIGHTGTLDPGASGVLPLVLGRATRLARFLSAADKTYAAVIRLGIETDTYDAEGREVSVYRGELPDAVAIERALKTFVGTFLQRPPVYSAKKMGGVRSYRAARQRDPADKLPARQPEPVPVHVHELLLQAVDGDQVRIHVTCSAGFYVRSLAHDLGRCLETGGHLAELRRTRSGALGLDVALPLARAETDPAALAAALIPVAKMLPGMPAATLSVAGVRRARHGQAIGDADVSAALAFNDGDTVRLLDPAGDLVGIAKSGRAPRLLHPVVILM
jgi:tRNA pseudouridine55 synthase